MIRMLKSMFWLYKKQLKTYIDFLRFFINFGGSWKPSWTQVGTKIPTKMDMKNHQKMKPQKKRLRASKNGFRRPRGAQEELPEGVYFWGCFLDQLLSPTWLQKGRGPKVKAYPTSPLSPVVARPTGKCRRSPWRLLRKRCEHATYDMIKKTTNKKDKQGKARPHLS